MEEFINKVIKVNENLFGINPRVNKINVGFTNTIYIINDKYIIKICSNISNEKDFVKEINFYRNNDNNELIPKLYFSDTSKNIIPYYYEIIEKINGVSLYNVWHTFDEKERRNVIQKLCIAMKKVHSVNAKPYDWNKYIKEEFSKVFNEAKSLNLFNKSEIELLEKSYIKFDEYLISNKFALIHNDLHFDNIFYKDGEIKLIDFERSMVAPIDFELDIFYRMIRMPWKFASEDTEEFTKKEDYENIMNYINEFYPELTNNKYLYQRLAIYDMIYFMKQYIEYPKYIDLKEQVINGAKYINQKEVNLNERHKRYV